MEPIIDTTKSIINMIAYALSRLSMLDIEKLVLGIVVLMTVSIAFSTLYHGTKKIFTFIKSKRG
jgi:hypothetical protein